jgi:hypothetical protein
MIAAAKNKPSTAFPRQKVACAVEEVLPRGQEFKLHVQNSNIGGLKIVRVVTPAWKNLRPWQRIGKIRPAIEGELSPAEQSGILRLSVLTPKEYKELVVDSGVPGPVTAFKQSGAKNLAAKRKGKQKAR